MIPYLLGGAYAVASSVVSSLSLSTILGAGGLGLLAADQADVPVIGDVIPDVLPSLGPLNGIQTVALAALIGAGAKLVMGEG